MKDDQKQESDDDNLDELIRGLVWLLNDMGEDLDMLAAMMAYLHASEQ